MKSIFLLHIVLFLFFGRIALSQSTEIDSLELVLNRLESTTERVDVLNQLARITSNISIPTSKSYAQRAKRLSQEIDYKKGEAEADYQLAYSYNVSGKLDSAYTFIEEAIALSFNLDDSTNYARSLVVAGTILGKQDQDSLAMDHFVRALQLGELLNDLKIRADASTGLANINIGLGYFDKARELLDQSLECGERLNDPKLIVRACVNLSILLDSVEDRRHYAERALEVAINHPNMNRELTYAYNVMGMLHYYNLGQIDSALYYKKLALARAKASEEPALIQMITGGIAEIYSTTQLDSAAVYYEKLLADTSVQTYQYHQELNLRKLARIRQKQGEPIAFQLLDSAYTMATARYFESLDEAIADANAKYETEKKEAEIARQELEIIQQKNNRNLILVIVGILLFSLILLGQYLLNRQKRKRKDTELALFLEQQRADDIENLAKAKTDLFNNVSHELRTPLTMVIGPLEQALKVAKNIPLKENIALALQNSRRLTGLVNEILDLSKLDAGKMGLDISDVNLLPFLKRTFQAFSSLASSQEVTLEDNFSELEEGDILIQIDVRKMEKIINNLVSNAIKFSKSGDKVQFTLDFGALQNGQLILEIGDEGPGIPTEHQPRIFDRYFQVPSGNQSGGTGIGLALTKELVEFSGGSVTLSSDGKKGSIFRVVLPVVHVQRVLEVYEEENEQEEHISDQVPAYYASGRPHILIVEDDVQMAKYLGDLLRDSYDITVAFNGHQALQKMRQVKFDLISSDIMMPEMDGFEFRNKVNDDPRWQKTPFIMLTARALEEDKLRGFQLGVDDYLVKPFSPEEYKARIKNLVKNKFSRSSMLDEPVVSHAENLVQEAQSIVQSHLDNPAFKVSQLANSLNYSSRQLGRILKKNTGYSPVEFILEVRLTRAYEIIQQRKFSTLSEVRFAVGIESASYFTTKFKERFGVNPSDMAKLQDLTRLPFD